MHRRFFFSVIPLRHFLPIIIIPFLLLALCIPARAAGMSLSFDSEGRTLRSVPRPGEINNSRTARNTAPEGVEILRDTAYEYYPVSGRTFSEIVRSVGENGPYNKSRTVRQPCRVDWTATLSVQYDFSYAIDEENGKMHAATEISDSTLEDSSTVTLPSLIDDTALNPVEQSMWRTYLSGLAEHCHALVAIIRDPQVRRTAREKMTDITYLIFDYTEGMDIEKSVEAFLRGEALRIGQEAVRGISARIADYEKTAAIPGRDKKQGSYRKNSEE